MVHMSDDLLTTTAAAKLLGVSRQHVVDLCERGDLTYTRTGTHRRIQRSEVLRLLEPRLTREEEKSLWLHRALLGHLMLEPGTVLEAARTNIRNWKSRQRTDSMATRYLEQWEQVIDGGIDGIVAVLTGLDRTSIELRQNSPFAGTLTDMERKQALRSFHQHWNREHGAA